MSWKLITVKFSNDCINCGYPIDGGETAYWRKGSGLKHVVCPEPEPVNDEAQFVVIDNDDKERLGIKERKRRVIF